MRGASLRAARLHTLLAPVVSAAALFVGGCGPGDSPFQALIYDLWNNGAAPPAGNGDANDTPGSDPEAATSPTEAVPPVEVQTGPEADGGETVVKGAVNERTDLPILELSTDALDFAETAAVLAFQVHNGGGGTMEYAVAAEVPWISVDPVSGTNQGAEDEISVRVDRSGLAAGDYSGQVSVTTSDGQQQQLAVLMNVPPPADPPPADAPPPDAPPPPPDNPPPPPPAPVLEVSPELLDFGPTDEQLTFTLRNTGGGTLAYTIAPDVDWAVVQPASGQLTTNTDTVTVQVNRDFLVTGAHSAQLTISADIGGGGTVTVLLTKRVTAPRILPIIDVGPYENLDETIAALLIWRRVTDTAIVILSRDCSSWYGEIQQQVPGMNVIPGLKTEWALGYGEDTHFEAPEGWQALAEYAVVYAAVTGQSRLFLEMEWPLEPYWQGWYSMDFAQLQQSLATWPDNPAVIWSPAISYCSTPALLERGVTLCAAVNEVLDVQFLDHSWGHPAWPTFPDRLEARAQLEALSANPPIPICWFGCAPLPDGGEFCYWADEQAHEAMDQLVGYSEVIFATGSLRAIEGAQNITANLAENDGAWK